MAVAGGLGQLGGALVGAALVLLLKNGLQDVLPMLTQRAGQLEAVAFAALFILLLHFARGGLMGFVRPLARAGRRCAAHRRRAAPAVEPLPRRTLPARGTPILSVEGAVKRFGGLVAVNDVSFDVDAGEIVGLIGPNGAGKSTMFNLLTCTLPMTAGQVRFLGHDIAGLPQRAVARLGLARTFQHVKLRPQMSLLDNVALGAHSRTARRRAPRRPAPRPRRGARSPRRGAAPARPRRPRRPRRTSWPAACRSGTQRILEIARALAADPVLLVLDEPAAGLRRKEKKALAELLRRLRDEGVTILIVEHDMDFVMSLVDRLVVMNFGAKLVEGAPAAVRADERVQAAYLGSVHAHDGRGRVARCSRSATCTSRYGQVEAVRGVGLTLQRGPDRLGHRPERRRQDDAARRGDGPAALQGRAALRRRRPARASTSRRASSAACAWCPRSASCSAS